MNGINFSMCSGRIWTSQVSIFCQSSQFVSWVFVKKQVLQIFPTRLSQMCVVCKRVMEVLVTKGQVSWVYRFRLDPHKRCFCKKRSLVHMLPLEGSKIFSRLQLSDWNFQFHFQEIFNWPFFKDFWGGKNCKQFVLRSSFSIQNKVIWRLSLKESSSSFCAKYSW